MPDEADRFGGLSDALRAGGDAADGAADGDAVGDDADAEAEGTEGTETDAGSATADAAAEDGVADADAEGDVDAFPEPFEFSETSQQSYYVRDGTFGPLAANRSRVRAVASKHGLDEGDLSKRELHDAELSVLQSFEDWDIAVAVEVLERRGVDVDEEEIRAVFDVLR